MASRIFFNRFLPEGSSLRRERKKFRWRACSSWITATNSSSLVEVGIQSAPRITGILRDLLRHSTAEPVTQKVPASYGDHCGTSLCSALLARESLSWFCAGHRHWDTLAPPDVAGAIHWLPLRNVRHARRCRERLDRSCASTILKTRNTLHPDTKITYSSRPEEAGSTRACY